ncbi:MAG: hypothetical protein KJ626_10695, partial [Verrucomicrobia bacterium]|nr:hypothetical protein [Verrucomicrobiota bacterium]
ATLQVANDDDFIYIHYPLHELANPNGIGSGTYLTIDEDTNTTTGFDIFGLGIVGSEASWQNDTPFEQATGVWNTGGGLTNAAYSALPYFADTTNVEISIPRIAAHATNGLAIFPDNGGSVSVFVWTDEGFDDIFGGTYRFSMLVTQPVFNAATITNVVAMKFQSQIGVTYRLDYAAGLPATNWISTGFTLSGNGSQMRAYDPTGYSTQKVYRIVGEGP